MALFAAFQISLRKGCAVSKMQPLLHHAFHQDFLLTAARGDGRHERTRKI